MWSLSIAALVAVAGEAFFVVVCAFIFSPFALLLSGMNTPFRRFLFDDA
jgi:predicted benzoate:H+ symporter BenE